MHLHSHRLDMFLKHAALAMATLGVMSIVAALGGCTGKTKISGVPDTRCESEEDCDDSDPCTVDECGVASGECSNVPVDGDGDGFDAMVVSGTSCPGTDCNDSDPGIHPGAEPGCEDSDRDCNGNPDPDDDGDGYVRTACGGDDCNDSDPGIHPGAEPGCEDTDLDCSGNPDSDEDGDGYVRTACGGDDCNDSDPAINPGAELECTDSDRDCNGNRDSDNDGDGYQRPACDGDDCDDTRADTHPGADEICSDGIDQDCDGLADGPLLFGDPVLVAAAENAQFAPSIAWTGSEYGIVWGDRRNVNFELYFAIAAADGTMRLEAERLTDAPYESIYPSLTWTGTEFGVAWHDERDGQPEIYFERIGSDGTEASYDVRMTWNGTATCPTSWPGYGRPQIIWTGSVYGLFWPDSRDGGGAEAYMVLLDPSGAPAGPETRITFGSSLSGEFSAVWTGTEFGVTWEERNLEELQLARVSEGGVSMGTYSLHSSRGLVNTSLDWASSGYVVAWSDMSTEEERTFIDIVGPPGFEFSPTMIDTPAGSPSNPRIAWTGRNLGIAWKDQPGPSDDGDYELWAGVLATSGEWIGDPLFIAVTDLFSCCYGSMDIVWGGSELAIAFASDEAGNHDIYLQRIGLCD